MAGHSKWANIKHRKARVDAQKGKVFTKISKEIMAAVRQGGADANHNFRLRLALQNGRSVNMPNDNIQRAIQKGVGDMGGANFEEIVYEGYGPAGTAVLLEILTDNRNRTVGEIRHILSRRGGTLGETGCVAWMFKRRGYLEVARDGHDDDGLMLQALDAGAEDFEAMESAYEIYTSPEDFETVKGKLEAAGIMFTEASITMIPENMVEVASANGARKALSLIEALEEHDDVQNVYTNLDVPADVMQVLENE